MEFVQNMVLKEFEEVFTKTKLKRLIKHVEIQKYMLRKQKKEQRILTLYIGLLQQWLKENDRQTKYENDRETKYENDKSNGKEENTNDGANDEQKIKEETETVDDIFDSFLEISKEFDSTKNVNKTIINTSSVYNEEMARVMLKDKIISDISNSNSKLYSKTNSIDSNKTDDHPNVSKQTSDSLSSSSEDDGEMNLKTNSLSGKIKGMSYQCFEIDFDILNEYIAEYMLDFEDLECSYHNENKITEGYKFLLAKERRKIEDTQRKLLKKYKEEMKLVKMMKGIYQADKKNYRVNVQRILELVYDYHEDSGTSVEEIFGMSQLKWSLENIESERLRNSDLMFDLKMDLNEITDEVLQKNDLLNYYAILGRLQKMNNELAIDYQEHVEMSIWNHSNDEEDEIIAEEQFMLKYIKPNGTVEMKESNNTKPSLISDEDGTQYTVIPVIREDEITQERDHESQNMPTTSESVLPSGKHYKIKKSQSDICPSKKPLKYSLQDSKLSFGNENLSKLKDNYRGMFFSPHGRAFSDSQTDLEKNENVLYSSQDVPGPMKISLVKETATETETAPVSGLSKSPPGSRQKLRRIRGQNSLTHQQGAELTKKLFKEGLFATKEDLERRNPLEKNLNVVNIQTVIVDGEVLKIADLSHRVGTLSVRNQPRRLSIKRRSQNKRRNSQA